MLAWRHAGDAGPGSVRVECEGNSFDAAEVYQVEGLFVWVAGVIAGSECFADVVFSEHSVGAGGEVKGKGLEGVGGFAEGGEGGEGVVDKLFGVVDALFDAEDGGPRGLDLLGVLTCGLAELSGVLGHVEDVVDDLEGESGFLAEGAKAGDGVRSGTGEVATCDDGYGNEGAGLGAVNALDEVGGGCYARGISRAGRVSGGAFAFGFYVHDLASDHARGEATGEVGAYAGGDGVGDLAGDGDDGLRGDLEAGDGLEGEGLKGVAGQDGGGFAEDDVAGGLAAAEVVVIEGGEVVMDEGIGMKHLKRRAKFCCGLLFEGGAGDHAGGFEGEDGAEALTAGEGAVAHRAMDGVGRCIDVGKQALESCVGEGCAVLQGVLDVMRHGIR